MLMSKMTVRGTKVGSEVCNSWCTARGHSKTIFRLFLPRIKSPHQVRSALPQSLPLLVKPALSLENWTAAMNVSMRNMSTTAAAVVLRDSHVSLTTQPLELDSGRYHRHLLALQTAVAARVSGEDKLVEMFFLKGK